MRDAPTPLLDPPAPCAAACEIHQQLHLDQLSIVGILPHPLAAVACQPPRGCCEPAHLLLLQRVRRARVRPAGGRRLPAKVTAGQSRLTAPVPDGCARASHGIEACAGRAGPTVGPACARSLLNRKTQSTVVLTGSNASCEDHGNGSYGPRCRSSVGRCCGAGLNMSCGDGCATDDALGGARE